MFVCFVFNILFHYNNLLYLIKNLPLFLIDKAMHNCKGGKKILYRLQKFENIFVVCCKSCNGHTKQGANFLAYIQNAV